MKSANEECFTCLMFQDNISAYIDGELFQNTRKRLLEHAEHCKDCRTLLKDVQHIKELMGNLTRADASPDFDFRMKALIRQENARFLDPLYRFRLFIRENTKALVTVPAVAALVIVIIFLSSDMRVTESIQPETTQNPVSDIHGEQLTSSEDQHEEAVHYVLDSVKSSEAEVGIFLLDQRNEQPSVPSSPDIKMISF